MPEHLLFGHGMILDTPFISDWEAISKCKQELIDKNNRNNNKNRKPYNCRVREKVPVLKKSKQISGAVQKPLHNCQGLDKWNC